MTDEPSRPANYPPQRPMMNGLPIVSQGAPWAWSFDEVGVADTEDGGQEKAYVFRLLTVSGYTEGIGPASYFRDMLDRIALDLSGLQIARDMPNGGGPPR